MVLSGTGGSWSWREASVLNCECRSCQHHSRGQQDGVWRRNPPAQKFNRQHSRGVSNESVSGIPNRTSGTRNLTGFNIKFYTFMSVIIYCYYIEAGNRTQ